MTPVMIRNQSLLMMTNKERMLVKSVAQEVKRSGLCSPYANQLQETSLVMLDYTRNYGPQIHTAWGCSSSKTVLSIL